MKLSVGVVALLAVFLASCGSPPPLEGRRATTTVVAPTVVPPPTTILGGDHCTPGYLPDPRCTPGSTNPAVTQANIGQTICVRGWTATVRPPVSVSSFLKRMAALAYGEDPKVIDPISEGDHLISLELGGNPESSPNGGISNFWDEPWNITAPDGQPAGSHVKDGFENYLHHQVCAGALSLAKAQREIATNWYAWFVQAGRPKG